MRRTLSIIGGIALGVMLSQFPEYAQQYEQRLGGAVDELRAIVEEFDGAATAAGLEREEALGRYAATGDDFIRGRGLSMADIIARYEWLRTTLADLQGATGWERAAHLPQYLDSEIGARALETYEPAVPVTIEGITWALAGFMLGYLIVSGIVRFLMLPFRRRHRREVLVDADPPPQPADVYSDPPPPPQPAADIYVHPAVEAARRRHHQSVPG